MKLKKNKFVLITSGIAFALVILLFSYVPTSAQEFDETPPPIPCGGNKPIARRNLEEILCLEDNQRRSIRLINADMKPQLDVARRRMMFAQRVLDETIYGKDTVDDSIVEQRARELAAAQAEFARTRALTDLKIRRVLTQEQVRRFLWWRLWKNKQQIRRNIQNQQQDNRQRQIINNRQQQNDKKPDQQQKRPQVNKRP